MKARIGSTVLALLVLLLALRILTWLLEPMLPLLVVVGALFLIYRFIFGGKRYF